MTNEEFNRTVEFLLSRQAMFEARMQKVEETQPKHERRIDETAELSRKTTEGFSELIDLTATLTNTVVDGFRVVFNSLTELSESNKHTDERIDALINSQIRTDEMFERHRRENHKDPNGAEN